MAYTPDFDTLSQARFSRKIDQLDVERAVRKLFSNPAVGYGPDGTARHLPGSDASSPLDAWPGRQMAQARAQIPGTSPKTAQPKAWRIWRHRSVGLARRIALLVMVATILAVQYV